LKIFIDTNVLINIFTFRDNGKSFELFKNLEKLKYEIYINDISIINIKYILRKSNQELVNKFLSSIINTYNVVCSDVNIIKQALNSDLRDFEDAVQYFCAKQSNSEILLTENKKDFKVFDITIFNTEELLNEFQKIKIK